MSRELGAMRYARREQEGCRLNLEDILDGGELLTQQLRGGINYRDCSYLPSRGRDSRGEGVLVLKGFWHPQFFRWGGQSTPSILNKQQSSVSSVAYQTMIPVKSLSYCNFCIMQT